MVTPWLCNENLTDKQKLTNWRTIQRQQLKRTVEISSSYQIILKNIILSTADAVLSLCKVQGFYSSILLKTELQLVLFSDNAYLSGTSVSRNTFQGPLAISAQLNMIQSSFLTLFLCFLYPVYLSLDIFEWQEDYRGRRRPTLIPFYHFHLLI